MQNKLEVTFAGDHIRVVSDGDKDFARSVKLWNQVADLSNQHDCFDVLGVANTRSPLEAIEGYNQGRLLSDLGIDDRYRIAWVELDNDARDMAAFIGSVLANRGLRGQLFDTVEEAESWLLRKDDTAPFRVVK